MKIYNQKKKIDFKLFLKFRNTWIIKFLTFFFKHNKKNTSTYPLANKNLKISKFLYFQTLSKNFQIPNSQISHFFFET